jgi:hypothetical protein
MQNAKCKVQNEKWSMQSLKINCNMGRINNKLLSNELPNNELPSNQ